MPTTTEDYMRIALALARKGWGETSPNPMVGAVLVKNGRIISQGWHHKDGAPHAEIECLRAAEESPEGAEMYVTLEPCSTHGRTGACCDAIAKAKIAKVYIGATDPNPVHAGRAKQVLQNYGIDCETGILADECENLNFIFNTSIVSQSAVIAIKYAISADDKISETRTRPTKITSDDARKNLMMWRRLFKSIAVGRKTLEADNPRLTARIEETETSPIRLVFDSTLSIAEYNIKKYSLFSDNFADKTRIVCGIDASVERLNKLKKSGINVMQIQEKSRTPEFWQALKKQLFNERINSLLIEGGAEIIRNVVATKSADFAFEYRNPLLTLGETAYPLWEKQRPYDFDSAQEFKLGNDTLTFGKISYR